MQFGSGTFCLVSIINPKFYSVLHWAEFCELEEGRNRIPYDKIFTIEFPAEHPDRKELENAATGRKAKSFCMNILVCNGKSNI